MLARRFDWKQKGLSSKVKRCVLELIMGYFLALSCCQGVNLMASLGLVERNKGKVVHVSQLGLLQCIVS
jgi:hypothetical protein